ncbi:alginate lyase family protein [Mongoliitalea lutea]|uniref:Alginate lyase domain-containing protein n=1 Tax=Mongoliitalea lutea TaxID=849756 RepID=A0A8J3CY56_9BACT|nr:alginate lyase family protein [Mongoliitalea lutea]GHB38841.1 hypothetical protein GCM10008106_20060 [Mongoliitalea lutea]
MKTTFVFPSFVITILIFGIALTSDAQILSTPNELQKKIIHEGRNRIIENANQYLQQEPVTVTAKVSERSAGGPNDFYSEGDYWWPDPNNPDGPFIQRDGERFTDRFEHDRLVLRDFAEYTAALSSAWLLTGDQRYADHALTHLKAWFTNPETLMNPHMLYAQAIQGRVTGRDIGIIDAYHLIEVAQSARALEITKAIPDEDIRRIKNWFGRFITWMTTHEYGIGEMNRLNNHATTWAVTASAMARFVGHEGILDLARNRFKYILLPDQMALDGSFPQELGRTKPYSYSLFNLDAFANLAFILSTPEDNLWEYYTHDGKSMQLGMSFLTPFIEDKSSWPFAEDIDIHEKWPIRHSLLLFAGLSWQDERYIDLFLSFDPQPTHPEVLRNHPVRHPIIWMEDLW